MEHSFNPVEIRILGTLIEKQITTPEYYPLTLNALVNGCNQKSNRYPPMNITEEEALKSLAHLQHLNVVQKLFLSNSRTERFKHLFDELTGVGIQEKVLLCELFIRGAQTVGELRTHAERMYPIASLEEAQKALDDLAERSDGPFVVKLERQVGQKECRYAHLFGHSADSGQAAPPARTADRRLDELEEKVDSLSREVGELKELLAKLAL